MPGKVSKQREGKRRIRPSSHEGVPSSAYLSQLKALQKDLRARMVDLEFKSAGLQEKYSIWQRARPSVFNGPEWEPRFQEEANEYKRIQRELEKVRKDHRTVSTSVDAIKNQRAAHLLLLKHANSEKPMS